MMPAEFVPRAVAVLADPGAQPLDFCNERLSIEVDKIFVHVGLPFLGASAMRCNCKANIVREH